MGLRRVIDDHVGRRVCQGNGGVGRRSRGDCSAPQPRARASASLARASRHCVRARARLSRDHGHVCRMGGQPESGGTVITRVVARDLVDEQPVPIAQGLHALRAIRVCLVLRACRVAIRDVRLLALGAVVPMLALVYVQTPERALANAFFVVVPLAAVFLSQRPRSAAYVAAIANGLVTAKVGLSTAWLPSSTILMIPAAASAAWVFWVAWRPAPDSPSN